MSDESNAVENTFAGVQLVNGTMVIPADRYIVRKVTIEEVDRMRYEDGEWQVPCAVHYEVTPDPGWRAPSFFVSSC